MCIKLSQDYSECGHDSTSITKCPTYYKQRSTARSILNFLLCKREKRKHCGRLVPHHVLIKEPYCERCLLMQSQSLRGKEVGRGAILIERQTVDEDFRRDSKKLVKRHRRKHSDRRHQSPDRKYPRHRIVGSKASVWLPDAYHTPQKFAQTESYRRSPAQAPPVSPPQASKPTSSRSNHTKTRPSSSHKQFSSTSRETTEKDVIRSSKPPREGTRSKKSTYDPRRRHEEATPSAFRGVPTNRTPASGDMPPPLSKPVVEPAPAYQYQHRQKFAAPPVVQLPPPSQGRRRRHIADCRTPSPHSRRTREADVVSRRCPAARSSGAATLSAGKEPEPEPEPAGPQLRRKQGKTFLNIRDQPLNTIPRPLPQYQVYLNAMPSLTPTTIPSRGGGGGGGVGSSSSSSSATKPPSAPHHGRSSHRREEVREERPRRLSKRTARTDFGASIVKDKETKEPFNPKLGVGIRLRGRNRFPVVDDDDRSDLSFVCLTSRRMSENGSCVE